MNKLSLLLVALLFGMQVQGFCYSFRADRDSPGTWWYVATLDDVPAISESLPVSYGKPDKRPAAKRAATAKP